LKNIDWVKRTTLITLLAAVTACSGENQISPVRTSSSPAYSIDRRRGSLDLIVRVSVDGRLLLNQIDVGSSDDPAELKKRLKTIFEDRAGEGLAGKELIVIVSPDWQGTSGLVEALEEVGAGPIRVVDDSSEQ